MKQKKLSQVLCLILALLALVFAGLWLHEKQERTQQLEALCQDSVRQAYEHFSAYETEQVAEEYWYGTAEFYSFLKAYTLLCDGAQQPDRLALNRAYGSMVLAPEEVQAHPDGLLDALELLAEDLHDPEGMAELSQWNQAVEQD